MDQVVYVSNLKLPETWLVYVSETNAVLLGPGFEGFIPNDFILDDRFDTEDEARTRIAELEDALPSL